jgi:hypothetical protein
LSAIGLKVVCGNGFATPALAEVLAMFNFFLGSRAAFHQVGMFVTALVCAGFGALLVGNAIYWALHAVRVRGEVIGVRQTTKYFNAVYHYSLPSGQSFDATSREGSSSVRGKATGTLVRLLVIPEKPGEVQEARSHVFTMIGVLLLVAAAWLFYIAVTAWPIGPMTWLVAALLIAHFGKRIYRIVFPKDKRLSLAAWQTMLRQRRAAAITSAPVQRIEDVDSLPQYQERDAQQRRNNRRFAPHRIACGPRVSRDELLPRTHAHAAEGFRVARSRNRAIARTLKRG